MPGTETPPPVAYVVDRDDRIVSVNDAWAAFAEANAPGGSLHPSRMVGQSLWNGFADDTTIVLYRRMMEQVRGGGGPIRLIFRCDAPGRRRQLALGMTSGADGCVHFEVTLVAEVPRSSVALLEQGRRRDERLLTSCSWCKRLLVPGADWVEVEEAVRILDLFGEGSLPHLTHGICSACTTAYFDVLHDPLFVLPPGTRGSARS
jgi:hypothetical protein